MLLLRLCSVPLFQCSSLAPFFSSQLYSAFSVQFCLHREELALYIVMVWSEKEALVCEDAWGTVVDIDKTSVDKKDELRHFPSPGSG